MRKNARADVGGWRRAAVTVLLLVGASALLEACSSTGGGLSDVFAKKDEGPDDISQSYFTQPAYCPPVRVRGGTESFVVYERGHEGEPSFVRYQGTITKTARECRKTVDGFTVKVGVAGRAVAGPKGGQDTANLPIRVVLTQESTGVVFSQLYKVQVVITPAALSGAFSQVVESIPVTAGPSDRDFIIYVGFDEGKSG